MSQHILASDGPPAPAPTAPSGFRQLLLGLLVGVGVGVVLIGWLGSAGRGATVRGAERQSGIVHLSALVDLVHEAQAAGEEVGPRVAAYVAASDEVKSARVVDLKARQLVADAGADATTEPLPMRLQRQDPNHKAWYDLGQGLRAAVEANTEEGRLWKEEIDVEPAAGDGMVLAAPLTMDGEVGGVVIVEVAVPAPALSSPWPMALAFLGGALVLFALVGWPLRGRRRVLQWLALAVAVAALAGFTVTMLGLLGADRATAEEAVAAQVAHAQQIFSRGAPELPPADAARWDVDRFRQPRGMIQAGHVDAKHLAEALAPVKARFTKVFGALGLLALLLGAFFGLGGAQRLGHTLVRYREAYLFVLPAMLGMLFLVFFPFLYGITLSFTSQTIYNLDEPIYDIWVGIDNYVDILSDFDLVTRSEGESTWNYQNFYWTLGFTIIWTVTNVTIGVSVGLFLALILNTKGLAFRPLYRVLLILPWAVPNYITALIWKGMFHQQFGVINQVIQIFGGSPVAWFDSPLTSFATVLATNGWLSFPFMMVVSLGALQSIPSDLYEAARVDGASRWQQFRLVTLPSLKPALVPAVILSVVWTFNMFNIIYLVSEGQPGGATEILITDAYKIAFEQYRYGYAAAYATVIFVILLIYGTWQNRVTRASEGV
ncbi:MAG: sugar ABC transporter permease [Acidobacteria bacterium]|nr:sugar ABC transporter permease [Acidobacteriota bacterium]